MTHRDYLNKAFLLSSKAICKKIKPNPFVGAIVVNEFGEIIGKGFHQKFGEAHAEVLAINQALSVQKDLSKSTLYVTLEPCSHYGKTPPCCELITKNKIAKVVIAMKDPNPIVEGIEKLQQHGVDLIIEELESVVHLNQTFIINKTYNRPKYFLKIAQTIDGKIADRYNESKWLTNEKSRLYAHENLRNRVEAILTTYKTIILDDASFNIRLKTGKINEQNCIVIDRDLKLLDEKNRSLSIFYRRKSSKIYLVTDKKSKLSSNNDIEIIETNWHNDKVDLIELSKLLYKKGFYEILVEGGGNLLGSFVEKKLADELWVYITSKLINDNEAIKSFNNDKITKLNNAASFFLKEIVKFDNDVLLKYYNTLKIN